MALSTTRSNCLPHDQAITSTEEPAIKRSSTQLSSPTCRRPHDRASRPRHRRSCQRSICMRVGHVPARAVCASVVSGATAWAPENDPACTERMHNEGMGEGGTGQAPILRVTPVSRSNSCYRHAVISRVTRACDETRWQTHSGEQAKSAVHPGRASSTSSLKLLVTPVHLWNRMTHWREADTR